MLDRLEFMLSEALTAMRRNGLMSFAAVTTVAISLFLLGGFGYTYYRVSQYAETIPGKFWMQVYLKDGVVQPRITETKNAIMAIPGVKAVNWIPRDLAWKRQQEKQKQAFAEIDNPLPDSFKVVLKELKNSNDVVAQVSALPNVEEIKYLQKEQQFIDDAMKLLRLVGALLGGLLFLTAGILIYNAIRLTVASRRLEIRIMQLVGASQGTIHIPFLIEGILQGAIGGVFSALFLWATELAVRRATSAFPITIPSFPLVLIIAVLAILGSFYGLVCSLLAVKAPLRFR